MLRTLINKAFPLPSEAPAVVPGIKAEDLRTVRALLEYRTTGDAAVAMGLFRGDIK